MDTVGRESEVIATVSPRSIGPRSLFDESVLITAKNASLYASSPEDIRHVKQELTQKGFYVYEEASNDKTITIGGSAKLFEEFFGARISEQTAETGPGTRATFMATSAEPSEALLQAPGDLRNLIEGVVISRPPTYFAAPAIPPIAPVNAAAYRYFSVPDGIAVMLRAARVHRLGVSGKGVVVAMPDTGMYAHPFYANRGYRVLKTLLAPGATDGNTDSVGHGTGEAANIFACAPDITLIPVKMGNDPVGALNAAVGATPKPHILTNSWGYDMDLPGTTIPNWLKPLELAVANAVASGIVVCFSAGNGHHGFPGSHPDVISAGGVHVNLPDINDFEASSYASGFQSTWYPGRTSPDVCGLTGKAVNINGLKAPSILLPVQEGASLDSLDPQTGPGNDGWGLFSGTSAASPQVAGVVALMLEKKPSLTPVKVKESLKKGARDVTKGTTATGTTAIAGPDVATGAGLVDAKWSYLITMSEVASSFFAMPKEAQLAMIESGQMPQLSPEFLEDLIDTLRSR